MNHFRALGAAACFVVGVLACSSEGGPGTGPQTGTGGFGASGGTGGTGGSSCKDNCTLAGDTQCEGDVVQTCSATSAGCLDWSDTIDCSTSSQSCKESAGKAQCAKSCTDMCDSAGSTQCNGSVVETCSLGADGCLDWQTGTDCDAVNLACDETSGTAQCVKTCTDQCPAASATQCDGNTIETCQSGSSGCLEWATTTDCTTNAQECTEFGGTPKCIEPCVNTCATAGESTCAGSVIETCTADTNGCLAPVAGTDCDATGDVCVQSGASASCQPPPPGGDTCAEPILVKAGANTIDWDATALDYLSSTPSCVTTGGVTGADVVLAYTPSVTGFVNFTLSDKPVNNRWVAVVSDAACGTLTPSLACASDYGPNNIKGSFKITSGTTYYFYVADTSDGSAPLSDPFKLSITETDCSVTAPAAASNEVPANGSTTTSLFFDLKVDFDKPVDPSKGTIIVLGDKGTNETYNLASNPTDIIFNSSNTQLTIKSKGAFPGGENLTVSWTGLFDAGCGKPVPTPTWSFATAASACSPGSGGLVGTTQTPLPTGGDLNEYYVEADDSPTGYVYVGDTVALSRLPKQGGALQNVASAAGLTGNHLGYAMAIAGNEVFTVDQKLTGTSGILWRISSDGGATWNVEDYLSMPTSLADDFRAARAYKGKLYLLVHESTASVGTDIWSVPLGATTLPVTATLEASIPNESFCSGLAVDDNDFYVACSTGTRLIRVSRSTPQTITVITTQIPFNGITNSLHAVDANSDGTADALYAKSQHERVELVCGPAGTAPTVTTWVLYDTGSSNSHGLGFDSVANALWVYEDTADDLIQIK